MARPSIPNRGAPVSKPPAQAAAKKAQTTITLKAVFEDLAVNHDLPKKQANAVLAAMVESVTVMGPHRRGAPRLRPTRRGDGG